MRWVTLCVGLSVLSTGTASSTTIYSHNTESLDWDSGQTLVDQPPAAVMNATRAFGLASSFASIPSVVDIVGSTSIVEINDQFMTILELNSSMGAIEIGTDASRYIDD